MALFSSIMCLLEVMILYKQEKREKTRFTPVFSLGFIYSVVMVLVSVYDIVFDSSYKMIAKVPLYSMLFILEFWFIGRLVMRIFKTSKKNVVEFYEQKECAVQYANFYKLLQLALIFLFFIFAVNFVVTFNFNIESTSEFKSYYSHGIMGHVVNLISVLFLAVSTIQKPKKLNIFIRGASFLWVLVLALANAKYSMFMYAFALLIIYTINYPKKFSTGKIIIYIGIIAAGFFLVYIFRSLLSGESLRTVSYEFIFHHFIYYISGGYYAFSSILEFGSTPTPGVGSGVFFAPIINIINIFTGGELASSTSAFIEVSLPGGYERTNVFTLFGSIWLEMGIWGVFLCVAILSILAYSIYSLFLRSNNKITTSLHAYISATLVFSFFNCFYGMLNIWELLVFILIIVLAYDISCASKVKQQNMQMVKA